ncbi:alpha-isopropylmalate synthase regulatory domain-containing protein [Tsukamurella soli]|uniref:2-isopropylmalate synthase LeuA allosteric (dimerisation) domain-containing protein n=1 Tax=Tsukamurella soli TaxID=644556 RepID=A0ABP8JCE4_9ACTN
MTITVTELTSTDPFADRFGESLPCGLRQSARGLTWPAFRDAYSLPADVTLESLTCRPRPGGAVEVTVTLTADGARTTATGRGTGPISAATDLLYQSGLDVEAVEFHQIHIAEGVATFIRSVSATRDTAARWSFAIAPDPGQSAVRALVAGAAMHRRPAHA